eukprot:5113017-Pyramimonas_sp.AAC.1
MGSSEEPVVFAKAMEQPMRHWIDKRSTASEVTHLRCGIFGGTCCGATTVYADDIFDNMPMTDASPETIKTILESSDATLDQELEE